MHGFESIDCSLKIWLNRLVEELYRDGVNM